MTTIGYVTKQSDDSYTGALKTLAFKAPVRIAPLRNSTADNPPDYVITSDDIEIGTARIRESKAGNAYVSLRIEQPGIGLIWANLGRAAGQDDPDVYAIIWNAD